MAAVLPAMRAKKSGSERSQRRGGVREGRARSGRRERRGPEFGFGAAMRVRVGVWVDFAAARRRGGRRSGVGGRRGGMAGV